MVRSLEITYYLSYLIHYKVKPDVNSVGFIHNWVITGFRWMVHWWLLVQLMPCTYSLLGYSTWERYSPVLGGYHIFMILVGFGFHRTIYKRVWFSLSFPPKIICQAMVSIFFYKKTGSQYAGSQNVENNQVSFVGSHKLGITY